MFTEANLESHAITLLQQLGWQYTHGKTIAPHGETQWRQKDDEVIFVPLLRDAISRLNPQLPPSAVEEAVAMVCGSELGGLPEQNKQAYQKLKDGIKLSYQQENQTVYDKVQLVDFYDPQNNRFDVVNQLVIKGRRGKRVPDVILYINGLPMALMELKNPTDTNATLQKAYNQLHTYKEDISDCFIYNQLLVISDGIQAKMGSLTASFDRFSPWRVMGDKSALPSELANELVDELQILLNNLCLPEVLLDYIQNFIVFEQDSQGRPIKKQANYHQYDGVNQAIKATLLARQRGDGKIGVVWHTQGSGKSLSMLFYVGKVMSLAKLANPTVVIVTDRNDLDGQLFTTFSSAQALIRETPIQADGRDNLRQALANRQAGGVIFTTIQKFMPDDNELSHPVLNDRDNIIVISDEAHRSQYGFAPKLKDGKYRTGYAKHLRDALPNASFIGFTGTPISLEDKDTQGVFGAYISVYDIFDAVNDGATVPIIYEPRQIGLDKSQEYDAIIAKINNHPDQTSTKERLLSELLGSDSRLTALAQDLIAHFDKRVALADGKAMIVASSRENCVKLYDKIIAYRPNWHSSSIDQGAIKVVMTGNASDSDELQRHIYSIQDKKTLEQRFKDPSDPLKLVIVRDMWLTGFDVPCCHTMYIDKRMAGHNLMQAIARVNRVFKNKSREQGGLIVDYVGLADELWQATQTYTKDGGKGQVAQSVDEVFIKMQECISIIRGQFATPIKGQVFDVKNALQQSDPNQVLQAVLQASNHILALDTVVTHQQPNSNIPNPSNPSPSNPSQNLNPISPTKTAKKPPPSPRKNNFLRAVRLAKKGYSLCVSMTQAKCYEKELAFYDAVRAAIVKNSSSDTAKESIDLSAVLNQAVVSTGVVDLFEMFKQDYPNVGVLSDEFLAFVQDSETKELWAMAVENYLKREINQKSSGNLSTQKEFAKRLQETMDKYHSHQLSVVQVLAYLIELGRELSANLSRGQTLGLSPDEIAFYDALAKNKSSEILGDETLRQMAKEITQTLKQSLTVDWQHKEDTQAKMRLLVRLLLRRYKYPPDKQDQAVEYVIKQAEMLAGQWAV